MDLDIEVARMRLLKSDYQSQRYRLEDSLLKYFPESIEMAKAEIAGYGRDRERLEKGTQAGEDGFSRMEIHGTIHTDKEQAGAAIIEACRNFEGKGEMPLGRYRGFDMSLSFDKISKEFYVTLKGEMSYNVELGRDAYGNITRLNNALASIPTRRRNAEARLENLFEQQKNARTELEKPFVLEKDLTEKSARLAVLDAQLNMDSAPEQEEKDSEKAEVKADVPVKNPAVIVAVPAAPVKVKSRTEVSR